MRAKHLKKPAAFPLEGLPTVKLAYRMWRAPALDFIVGAGASYHAGSGLRVDRRASVRAAGELARMSYDFQRRQPRPWRHPRRALQGLSLRSRWRLLGPLDATHFAVGDVSGPTNRLIAGGSGRGAEVTNRPLFNPASFDRTRFEGDLPPGWEAELYRNGQLVAFAKSDAPPSATRSRTSTWPMATTASKSAPSDRRGKQRSRVELLNVGQQHVPPGTTYYYAGINQPGSDLLGFVGDRPPVDRSPPRGPHGRAQAAGRGRA